MSPIRKYESTWPAFSILLLTLHTLWRQCQNLGDVLIDAIMLLRGALTLLLGLATSFAIAPDAACLSATTPVTLRPSAILISKPDPVSVIFEGPNCSKAGVWEVAFGGQRALATFAEASNTTAVLIQATPPSVPSSITVDVKVFYNSQAVHVSPQALVYYGPFALDRAVIQSSSSFIIHGRSLPVLLIKPTVALRVSLSTSLSPRLFSLVVGDHTNQTVRQSSYITNLH